MLDRCGTEGQQTDEDPRYNSTVGISSGLNVGAHLDFGVLSVMVRREPNRHPARVSWLLTRAHACGLGVGSARSPL